MPFVVGISGYHVQPQMPREPKLRSLPHSPPSRTIGLRRMTCTPCVLYKGCDTIPNGTERHVAMAVQAVTMGGDLGENHTIRSMIVRVQLSSRDRECCVWVKPSVSLKPGRFVLITYIGGIACRISNEGGVHAITQLRIPTSTVIRRSTETPRSGR